MEKNYLLKKLNEKILNFFDINHEESFFYLTWFNKKIDLHLQKNPELKLNKWEIYFVDLWKNIWSELSKKRPCIIYTDRYFNNWETVVILPLKSFEWKKYNRNINIFIEKDKINKLKENSITDLSWIRQISKKRIWWYIWNLNEDEIFKINKKLSKFLWIKNKQ